MTRPVVSIVLPVRDGRDTLPECLDSIAAQTERNYEVIAVNDHSGDDSLDLLRRAAERDTRIRLLDRPARGLVASLNAALDQCRTSLVARMDADDLMHPERLAQQLATFRAQPDLAVLATRVRLLETDVTGEGQREYVRWQNDCVSERDMANQRFVESPITHPTVMFRRDVVIAAGGYRDGPFAEDYDLWLRLFEQGHRIAKIPEVLLDWRDGATRLSRTDERCSRQAFDALRAVYLARDARVRDAARGVVVWGAGRRTRLRVRHLQSHGVSVRAWIDIDPKKINNVIDGARVQAPAALREMDAPFVLSYVANHGARSEIGAFLERTGLTEGKDWLSVG